MEVFIVNEQKVCADFCHQNRNCRYARIVEENGQYPVSTFKAKGKNGYPDPTTMHDVETRIETTCLCVYCTHPSYPEEKFIGSVEPYFPCPVPSDCPLQIQCESATCKKLTLLERLKIFFIK